MNDSIMQTLQHSFGFDQFRHPQHQIIQALISGQDCMAVLPTGAGKSLCFQLPAVLFPGLTIVISPLLALMRDQIHAVSRRGIAAATWNSESTPSQEHQLLQNLAHGRLRLLYLSPEKLMMPRVQQILARVPISHLAVDEAHCISQWGHDFRPEYRHIVSFVQLVENHQPRPVVSAFTGTADQHTRHDIMQSLQLKSPALFATPSLRPNLQYTVLYPNSEAEKRRWLLLALRRWNQRGSAIIYASTRHQTEFMAWWIHHYTGIPALNFHAGLSTATRHSRLSWFLQANAPLMVCTSAFGMGIDKPDVRWVMHVSPPTALAAYVQEAGRAGRDGRPAHCLLLYRPQDLEKNVSLQLSQAPRSRHASLRQQSTALHRWATGHGCLSKQLQKHYTLYPARFKPDQNCCCSNCLIRKRMGLRYPGQDFWAVISNECHGLEHD